MSSTVEEETSGKRIARVYSYSFIGADEQVGLAAVIDADADHHYQTGWDGG